MDVEREIEIALLSHASVGADEIQAGARVTRARASVRIDDRNWIDEPVLAASGIGGVARDLGILCLGFVQERERAGHVEAVVRGTAGGRHPDRRRTGELIAWLHG